MAPTLRLLAFLVLLLGLAHPAASAGLEAGLGVAQYNHREDGVWYQQGLPHSLSLQAPAVLIGAWGDVTPFIRWHVDAVDLGSASVDSWDTPADSSYSTATKRCISGCNSLMHLHATGGVYGISATLEGHTSGSWQFGVEAGPWLYHSSWSVQVPGYFAAAGWPESTTAEQVAPWGWMPGGIQRSQSGWALGGVVGLTAHSHGVGLSIRRYFDGRGWPMHYASGFVDGWPPIWTGQTVLMLTRSF